MRALAAIGCPTPPYSGGFLEWPDWLVHDLAIISTWHTALTKEDDNG
jgi:hypothetical protein